MVHRAGPCDLDSRAGPTSALDLAGGSASPYRSFNAVTGSQNPGASTSALAAARRARPGTDQRRDGSVRIVRLSRYLARAHRTRGGGDERRALLALRRQGGILPCG